MSLYWKKKPINYKAKNEFNYAVMYISRNNGYLRWESILIEAWLLGKVSIYLCMWDIALHLYCSSHQRIYGQHIYGHTAFFFPASASTVSLQRWCWCCHCSHVVGNVVPTFQLLQISTKSLPSLCNYTEKNNSKNEPHL